MKKLWKKALAFMLVLAISVSVVNVPVYAQANTETQSVEFVTEETTVGTCTEEQLQIVETVCGNEAVVSAVESQSNGWDGVTTQQTYEGENYKITFMLDGYWNGGYNAKVKIQNTSNVKIENWYVAFDFANCISNLWNAEISTSENGNYILKNAGYNQDIAVNGAVEFGFGARENFKGFPTECVLLGEETETNEEDYTINYNLDNDWGSGFVGAITITNDSEQAIEDWRLEFDFDRNITGIWNGLVESHEGNHYVVKNAGYNADIAPGQTVSFGFSGNGGSKENEPSAYQLHEYEVKSNYKIVFEVGDGTVTNVPETQIVEKGQYATKPEKPEREGYLFLGWFEDKAYTEYFDFENTIINKNVTLYAKWVDYLCETDMDGDGLSDTWEELFLTDPNSADTDGDGLLDCDEIMIFSTKPFVADTDGNGILDGDEDLDGDTLTNKQELIYGTSPMAVDTDSDRLNDCEEIEVYGTNPVLSDTDNDGVSDGKEIELGTDPLIAQDKFQITMASDNDGIVKASVEIELDGEQVETLGINVVNNDLLFPNTIPGYMGEAYDFTVNGTFETATLHFKFSEELLETEGLEPTIYYFNEEEQQLEALETSVSGNIASTEVTHFSKYILLNRKVFQDSFEWQDTWESDHKFTDIEIVFVVDDSGSMDWNDPSYERLAVARTLIDNLPSGSKIGLVRFDGGWSKTEALTSSLTTDKEEVKNYLTTEYFYNPGGTDMYNGIQKAFPLYESAEDTTLKMMIVLSDGVTDDTYLHSTVVSTANKNNIRIYTVGLGSSTSYFNSYMKPLANNTGASFYLASDATQLADIYKDINKKIDIETDSDKDGIADYYEDNLVLFNGTTLKLDKNDPDTDGDGVLDGEEIVELKYEYNKDKTKVRVTGKLKSNPASIDSDGDGLYDYSERVVNGRTVAPIDPEPLKKNGPDGVWDNHVYQQEYGVVATQYADGEGMQLEDITNSIRKYIYADIPNDEELADAIVELIVKLEGPLKEVDGIASFGASIVRKFCNFAFQTEGGAYILNFVYDDKMVAYHSKPDTWQRYFGYNRFYDLVFEVGSNMHYLPFEFSTRDEEYVLWMWKGDYWNLQSGAEIGLYMNPQTYGDMIHYDTIDFEVPMTLSLYNYYNKEKIDNIFNWAPEVEQWWITGFSGQNKDFMNPDPEKMVVVGTVDLSENTYMYNALKGSQNDFENLELIFDDTRHTVWINWYQGVTR